MEEKLTVTAIIPTFNRSDYLGEAIESVLGQTCPPEEVIVVDDGSTDATQDLVRQYADRVLYVRKDNGGKSTALNLGLKAASNAAIWIMDDDDIAEPRGLERLRTALKARGQAGFAFGAYRPFTSDGRRMRLGPERTPKAAPGDFKFTVIERCTIFQPAMLVRRSAYEAVGPFDPALVRAQDYDMLVRLAHRFDGVEVPEVIFHQRQHPGPRGDSTLQAHGVHTLSRQKLFDQKIVAKAYEAWALEDFLPGRDRGPDLSPADRYRALIRRACVLARKALWIEAADNLEAATVLFRRHRFAQPLPDRTAISGIFHEGDIDVPEAGLLFEAVAGFDAPAIEAEIRALMLWPQAARLVRSLRAARLDRARQLLRTLRRHGDASTVPRLLRIAAFKALGRSLDVADRP